MKGAMKIYCAVLIAFLGFQVPISTAVKLIHSEAGTLRRKLAVGDGYWSTNGSKIIDAHGNEVFFSGVNWGGFDGVNCVVDGLQIGTGRSLNSYILQIAGAGLNLIRLSFAGLCVQPYSLPGTYSIDYNVNPDLAGLSSLEVMQKVVEYAGAAGVRIILDYHRKVNSASGLPEDGFWFDKTYPESYWLNTWQNLTELFAGNPTVVGADLFNEPHNGVGHPASPVWTSNATDPYNWHRAAYTAASVIQKIEPNWLICVQGMWNSDVWWGANLQPVETVPLVLNVPHKLVYEIHDYGPIVSGSQSWLTSPGFYLQLNSYWDSKWGFVAKQNIAPVWIGEFGSFHNTTYLSNNTANATAYLNQRELLWFNALVAYIKQSHFSWTWFTWTPKSRDTGGLLDSNYTTIIYDKLLALQPITYPQFMLPSTTNLSGPASPSPPPSTILAPVGVYFPPPLAIYTPPPPAAPKSHGFLTSVPFLLGVPLWAVVACISAVFLA